VPLNFTLEADTNPVPFTVSVKPAPPAVALVGESEVMVGAGLFTGKFMAGEAPPPGPGLLTTTGRDPAVAMSGAVTAMVTCVALTNVTVLPVPLNVPVAPLTKFVPLIVSVKAAPPAVALVGENDVIAGTGLLMEKFWVPEVPPPGAGLVTLTVTTPAVAMSGAVITAVN
jgi:xanthosine utilization system XapX-like protein